MEKWRAPIAEVIARMKERLGTACFGSADADDAEQLIEEYERLQAERNAHISALRSPTWDGDEPRGEEPHSMEQGDSGIRQTALRGCIDATILDITATDPETFLQTGENRVFLHLSNGETIFMTTGVEGSELVGLLGDDEEEGSDGASTNRRTG